MKSQEIVEAEDLLKKFGYDLRDFDIKFSKLDKIFPDSSYVPKGMLTVLRVSKNIKKEYETGHGTNYPCQLEIDLSSKLF